MTKMKLVVPLERRPFERRVAASPDTVKKLVGKGLDVVIETGAGLKASVTDAQYEAAGAKIEKDPKEPQLLQTVRLGGYVFTAAVERE